MTQMDNVHCLSDTNQSCCEIQLGAGDMTKIVYHDTSNVISQ